MGEREREAARWWCRRSSLAMTESERQNKRVFSSSLSHRLCLSPLPPPPPNDPPLLPPRTLLLPILLLLPSILLLFYPPLSLLSPLSLLARSLSPSFRLSLPTANGKQSDGERCLRRRSAGGSASTGSATEEGATRGGRGGGGGGTHARACSSTPRDHTQRRRSMLREPPSLISLSPSLFFHCPSPALSLPPIFPSPRPTTFVRSFLSAPFRSYHLLSLAPLARWPCLTSCPPDPPDSHSPYHRKAQTLQRRSRPDGTWTPVHPLQRLGGGVCPRPNRQQSPPRAAVTSTK